VREIKGAVGPFSPTAIAAEEFSCARVPQQSFHRLFEIHGQKVAYNSLLTNRVYP